MTADERLSERCGCELPGPYFSGVPGILAAMTDEHLAPGAIVERCDECCRFESDTAALARLIELGMAAPQLATQRNSFTVHCFLEVRVTFPGIAAADAKRAVERAAERFCWDTHGGTAEFADGFSEFLVDVDGDEDYGQSQRFNAALEEITGRSVPSHVWTLVIDAEYERRIHVCASQRRALKLLYQHVIDGWHSKIGDIPLPEDRAEAIHLYFADAPEDYELEQHVVA